MIGIGQMYRQANKIFSHGIQGYEISKKYETTQRALKQRNLKDANKPDQKKVETKRGSYLEDYAKNHDFIPGPGVYQHELVRKESKKGNEKIKAIKKMTYIDQIFQREKKEKTPAPGQYKIEKDDNDVKQEKKRLASRKITPLQRFTYLDGVQYEASKTPGVGNYNPQSFRPRSATMFKRKSFLNTEKRLQSAHSKKRQKNIDLGAYNSRLAGQNRSFSKKSKVYHDWGRGDRFPINRSASHLGPGSYLPMDTNNFAVRKNSKNVYYS